MRNIQIFWAICYPCIKPISTRLTNGVTAPKCTVGNHLTIRPPGGVIFFPCLYINTSVSLYLLPLLSMLAAAKHHQNHQRTSKLFGSTRKHTITEVLAYHRFSMKNQIVQSIKVTKERTFLLVHLAK